MGEHTRRRAGAAGLLAAALVAMVALPPAVQAAAESAWSPTTGGWVSGPVEHVMTIPEELGSTGSDAVVHDGLLYLTTWKGFSIYDVSDPESPQQLATRVVGPHTFNENPQTNGEILLLSSDTRYSPFPVDPVASGGGVLDIYDVTDPADPQRIGRYFSAAFDHLWTCVLDCTYAYSATGTILDLSDPTSPQRVGRWTDAAASPPEAFHHITEVAPGIVFTGSVPMWLLDAREDPGQPARLGVTDVEVTEPETLLLNAHSIPARVAWPNAVAQGKALPHGDRFTLVTMETPFTGVCSDESGEVIAFDTSGWQGTGGFTAVDRYRIATNGVYADGKPPAGPVGCGAYGLAIHPGWGKDGRLAATTFFEHGIRLLRLDEQGAISEVGGFLPHAGNSTAVRWLADDLLYVVDINRGIDILRVDVDATR